MNLAPKDHFQAPVDILDDLHAPRVSALLHWPLTPTLTPRSFLHTILHPRVVDQREIDKAASFFSIPTKSTAPPGRTESPNVLSLQDIIMKLTQTNLLLAFFVFVYAPSAALAKVNGHCVGDGDNIDGICIDRSRCRSKYKGTSLHDPFCPNDPVSVECCYIRRCPGKGVNTLCTWRDECINFFGGKILPGKEETNLSSFSCGWCGCGVDLPST